MSDDLFRFGVGPPSQGLQAAMCRLHSRMNIGTWLCKRRMDLGISQTELARRAGTNQSRISEIETLNGNVTFDTLDRIAMALGLEITLQERPDRQPPAATP